MPTPPDYVVRLASWEHDRLHIQHVRRSVFIEEQRIAERGDEWDELDPVITHVLVFTPPLPRNVTRLARAAWNPPVRLAASQ